MQKLRLVYGGLHSAPSRFCAGRKSSAVTAPPVASRMRAATSLPGQAGVLEQSNVTYDGATPIASAKADRLVRVSFNHCPSLLIDPHYSVGLNFSQDEKFSGAIWTPATGERTLPGIMGKQNKQERKTEKVFTRFKQPKGLPLLRKWRKHRGLTQDRLADRMAELLDGFSTSSISQLESCKQGYSQDTLEALAVCLDCRPGEILMRDPTTPDANLMIAAMKPETRRQAIAMLKALEDNDRAEKAA